MLLSKDSGAVQQPATPHWLYRTHLPIPAHGLAICYTSAAAPGGADVGLILELDGHGSSTGSIVGSSSHRPSSDWYRIVQSGQFLMVLPPHSAASARAVVAPEQLPYGLPLGTTVMHATEGPINKMVHFCQADSVWSTVDSTGSDPESAPQWITRSCAVASHHLQHRHITAIGVVPLSRCLSDPAQKPQRHTAAAAGTWLPHEHVLVGRICIKEQLQPDTVAAHMGRPAIVGLQASHVQLQSLAASPGHETVASSAAEPGHCLLFSCRLSWHAVGAGSGSESFHVWMCADTPVSSTSSLPLPSPPSSPKPSAAAAAATMVAPGSGTRQHAAEAAVQDSGWQWVGQAFATSFHVCNLPIHGPGNGPAQQAQPSLPQQEQRLPSSVVFAVEPSGRMGCLRPLHQASTLRVTLTSMLHS